MDAVVVLRSPSPFYQSRRRFGTGERGGGLSYLCVPREYGSTLEHGPTPHAYCYSVPGTETSLPFCLWTWPLYLTSF